MNYLNQIINDDCFNILPNISDNSVDTVIADLPYGLVNCKWDSPVDLKLFWEHVLRITTESAPIILFGSQPFTSILVTSNIKMFKYEWIWEKSKASNFLDCKKRPMKAHESILVFCKNNPAYYPQMTEGKPYDGKGRAAKNIPYTTVYNKIASPLHRNDNTGTRYPRSVQYFKTAESEGKQLHPTQKPLPLLNYLIKTHTKENDLILDPCIGSGTTIIACAQEKRNYIGIEKDKNYHAISVKRLQDEAGRAVTC